MRLSNLQRYILISGYGEKSKFSRRKLLKFYERYRKKPKIEDQVNIITKSLERLIDKEFLIGYGVRTPKKWFIKEIKLTVNGRRVAKRLRGEQQTLPLKIN
jgi:hypothetical protein